MCVNMRYFFFSFWLISLCITVSRSIHVLQMTRTCSFSRLSNIPLYVCGTSFFAIYLINGMWCTLRFLPCLQFSLVAQSCPTVCDPMEHSTPGLPVHQQLSEFAQTHVHGVGDVIQQSHPLPSPSPPALNLSQHQGLFQWVGSLHQVAKVLELQLQNQSFQWIFRSDVL